MSFIKNLFNGILSFFGGILKFFTGLVGSKDAKGGALEAPKTRKGSGYFLELDEAQGNKSAANSSAQTETAKPEKPESAKAAQATATKSQPAKAESTQAEPAKATATATATKSKPAQAEPTKVPEAKGDTQLVQTAEGVKVEKADTKKPGPVDTKTFAPNFLLSPSSQNGRRRPGPNMNYFLDMARQVKTPG